MFHLLRNPTTKSAATNLFCNFKFYSIDIQRYDRKEIMS